MVKFEYGYLGHHKALRLKSQKDWDISKEKKLVAGTYDDVITKRSVSVIVVMQSAEDIKNGTCSLRCMTLFEDAAFGVYDGSKFTGKYYFANQGAPVDLYKPKDKMMKNKGVLK